ncbi:hypothetical protein MBANPS3_004478 [Mucor bainieri]
MTSKATQEYRSSFITLISQLSEIEQKGQEFFDKIEKSVFTPYDPIEAKADYAHLMSTLEALETHARSCGLLSISGQADAHSTRNLATRNAETLQAVDAFFQEKNRLLMNIRAAVNASSVVGSLTNPATTSNATAAAAAAAAATSANTTK